MKWYCIVDARFDGGCVVFDSEREALEFAKRNSDVFMVVKGEEVDFEN